MNIDEAQKNWDELGKTDPMWAVFGDPEKKGGKWDPVEFFQTGVAQIDGVFAELESMKVLVARDAALDFGCGVGRLTQALAGRFAETHGVDIAPSMVEQAQGFNRFPDRCHYHVNSRSDLTLLGERRFDSSAPTSRFSTSSPVCPRVSQGVHAPVAAWGRADVSTAGGHAASEPGSPIRGCPGPEGETHSRAYLPAFGIREKSVTCLIRAAGCHLLRVRRAPLTPNAGSAAVTSDLAFILKQIKIAERHSRALAGDRADASGQPEPDHPTRCTASR